MRQRVPILLRPGLMAGFLMIAGPSALGECKVPEENACVIRLQGKPGISETCVSEAWRSHIRFPGGQRPSDTDGNGWFEMVVELDLDARLGCSCAVLRVHYTEAAWGWTVGVGDSASNDGYGGDAGTDPKRNAELQVVGKAGPPVLTVFSATLGRGDSDPLLSLDLPELEGHYLELEICDQFLGLGVDGERDRPGALHLRTPESEVLWAIAMPGSDPSIDAVLHAAFNRVIHERGGKPWRNRTGRGVGSVEIFLTP